MNTIKIEVTIEQANTISKSLDLMTRMTLGQIEEIDSLIRMGLIPMNDENIDESDKARLGAMDRISNLLRTLKIELGFHPNESYGVGHGNVNIIGRRAYEIKKVLNKALVDVIDPNPEFKTVDHDGLTVRYTDDPEPSATVSSK